MATIRQVRSMMGGNATVLVTIGDTTPPSTPVLTAAQNSASPTTAIDLSCTVATDSSGVVRSGVAKYTFEWSATGANASAPSGTLGWTVLQDTATRTYTHSGRTPGTTYYYRVSSVDTGGNRSATFSTASRQTQTAGGTTINTNFGHWWQITRAGNQLTQSYRINTLYPKLFTAQNTVFKGIAVEYRWVNLETSQGNAATVGAQLIQAELAALRTYSPQRRLVIQFRPDRQNLTYADRAQMFPAYLYTAGPLNAVYQYQKTQLSTPTNYITWDVNNTAAMAAYTAMWTDLINALKQNATDWAQIEGFRPFHEVGDTRYGTSVAGASASVSSQQFHNHVMAVVTLFRQLAPDKMVWINLVDGYDKNVLLDHMDTKAVLPGHGDTLPMGANGTNPAGSSADRVLIGTEPGFPTDRRVTSAIVMAAEGSELGQGAFHTYTPQEIYDYINNPMHAHYLFWDARESGSGYIYSDIKTFCNNNPNLQYTSKPACYP